MTERQGACVLSFLFGDGAGRGQPHSAARNVYRRKTGARAIVSEGSDDPPLVSRTQHIDMRPAQRARAGASYGAALVDDREMPVMVFIPEGTREWWVDLDIEEAA